MPQSKAAEAAAAPKKIGDTPRKGGGIKGK
jgi:hypothetical protein